MATRSIQSFANGALTGTSLVNVTAEDTNADTLTQKAQAAFAANSAFLGIGSPSNAQVVAQVQRLTRECNGIIRLLLSQFDADDS